MNKQEIMGSGPEHVPKSDTEFFNRLYFIGHSIFDFAIRERVSDIVHKKFITKKKTLNSLVMNKPHYNPKYDKYTGHELFERFLNLLDTDRKKMKYN